MWDESHWVLERLKLHELRQVHPEWSYGQYAKALKHDPGWVRKWCKRLQDNPVVTLKTLRSQSRAPHHPPERLSDKAKDLVVELRHELSEKFHRRAGPKLVQYGLSQYQQSHTVDMRLPQATSTIARILKERGCIASLWKTQHEMVQLPAPMEEWELDFGEIYLGEDEGVFEFLLVVDRGTSRVVFVESRVRYDAQTALESVATLLREHGLPKRLRFDRDPRLWGSWTRDSYPSPMVRFLRVLGIEPVVCPPRRPDKKPFVERCIGTLKHEWLDRFSPATRAEALEVLAQFPHYYNATRPHQGHACQNRPPDMAFPTLPLLPSLPERVLPDNWLDHEHGRTYRRHVNASGTVQVDRHTYSVGSVYAGKLVLVHLDAVRQQFHLIVEGLLVKTVAMQGLVKHPMDFEDYLVFIQEEAHLVSWHRHLWWERTAT